MKPVTPQARPDATAVVFAKDQPEYEPLPANVSADGLVMTEWAPTVREMRTLELGGVIRLWIWTGGQPLQPVALEAVDYPACGLTPHG